MSSTFEIPEKTEHVPEVREDLRPPKVCFGRCGITGQFGKVIALDLGDIEIQSPNTEEGVTIDPLTGKVGFDKWKGEIINAQLTVSEDGLNLLLKQLKVAPHPMHGITPELVYFWKVTYVDNSEYSQFYLENGEEKERSTKEIAWGHVEQVHLIPRYNDTMPIYTFDTLTGTLLKGGNAIDYHIPTKFESGTHELILWRKNTIIFGASMEENSLDRVVDETNISVLYLLGWQEGGVTSDKPGFVIAVDDRGNWRPYYAK